MRRMGDPTGPGDGLRSMFALSLGAKSFAAFWRYWNPVYHYLLSYWICRPVRAVAPRPVAVLVSFAFCGFFLHDLPLLPFTHMPMLTVWFLFLGTGVVVGEAIRMDPSAQPRSLRVMANVVYIAGSCELARRTSLGLCAGLTGSP
jgi:hypothetical protein